MHAHAPLTHTRARAGGVVRAGNIVSEGLWAVAPGGGFACGSVVGFLASWSHATGGAEREDTLTVRVILNGARACCRARVSVH